MMPSSELINILRTGAQGLDLSARFLILDACDRLERQIRDNELLMKKIVELQARGKWIPVSERLPEDLPENEGKKVINCIVAHRPYHNGKLTSQFRQRKWDKWDNKWYWSKIGGSTVTHWMPLPEPPKGE